MGEMTIRDIDEALLVELREAAGLRGGDVSDLVRDVVTHWVRATNRADAPLQRSLTQDEQDRRDALVEELRDIRAMTLTPLTFNSTLIIREMRDADG